VCSSDLSVEDEFRACLDNLGGFDYFFIHVKGTDEAGEDGAHARKVKVIEEVDAALPMLLEARPEVIAVTGDHSTPCPMKLHSWHPVPLLLHSPRCGADRLPGFAEGNCDAGSLGTFPAMYLLPLMLANAGLLDKFGA
jgi:2,3-bisphosphoglycerate-independent phosphoglycerate mutase